MNWNNFWNTCVDFFKTNGWNIVKFFAILILGIVVIKVVLNITRNIFGKTKIEKIAQQFLMGSIKFALYLILVLILLSTVGIQVTGIVTALSAVLLAVGMALQSNIANLANGIVIVATKMFKKGDFISVGGVDGNIVDINFLFTTLQTTDNKKITMPNSSIVNGTVVNAGANKTRRVDFMFSVAYETDVELVKKIVTDVMKSNGKVYLNKEPFCRLKFLGASSIDFAANCWCDTEDYWDVYYYVMENVYNEFKRNNISIPYNQLEVRNRTDNVVMPYNKAKLPERVEKVRSQKENFDLETVDITKIFKRNSKNQTQPKTNNTKTTKPKKTKSDNELQTETNTKSKSK